VTCTFTTIVIGPSSRYAAVPSTWYGPRAVEFK